MKELYLTNYGTLRVQEETLLYETKESSQLFPVIVIESIHLLANVHVTLPAVRLCAEHNILLFWYNQYHESIGTFSPNHPSRSNETLLAQAAVYLNPDMRLKLAKHFVHGSLQEMIHFLKFSSVHQHLFPIHLLELERHKVEIDSAETVDSLLIVEANCRKLYYQYWKTLYAHSPFPFSKRSKRPPLDEINALTSWGNTLLYQKTLQEIHKSTLDPRISVLHSSQHRSYSLHLDVAELFKPFTVDWFNFLLVFGNVFTSADFVKDDTRCYLSSSGKARYLSAWNIQWKSKYPLASTGSVILQRHLILELQKLKKAFTHQHDYTPYTGAWKI